MFWSAPPYCPVQRCCLAGLIDLEEGSAYLVAIMDGFIRYVLPREASNTLESAFCVSALG